VPFSYTTARSTPIARLTISMDDSTACAEKPCSTNSFEASETFVNASRDITSSVPLEPA